MKKKTMIALLVTVALIFVAGCDGAPAATDDEPSSAPEQTAKVEGAPSEESANAEKPASQPPEESTASEEDTAQADYADDHFACTVDYDQTLFAMEQDGGTLRLTYKGREGTADAIPVYLAVYTVGSDGKEVAERLMSESDDEMDNGEMGESEIGAESYPATLVSYARTTERGEEYMQFYVVSFDSDASLVFETCCASQEESEVSAALQALLDSARVSVANEA